MINYQRRYIVKLQHSHTGEVDFFLNFLFTSGSKRLTLPSNKYIIFWTCKPRLGRSKVSQIHNTFSFIQKSKCKSNAWIDLRRNNFLPLTRSRLYKILKEPLKQTNCNFELPPTRTELCKLLFAVVSRNSLQLWL